MHRGPEKKNPGFRLWAELEAIDQTPRGYAASKKISHQVLSYYANGDRWTPLAFAEEVQKDFPRVTMADWPRVWDRRASGKRWVRGKLIRDGKPGGKKAAAA